MQLLGQKTQVFGPLLNPGCYKTNRMLFACCITCSSWLPLKLQFLTELARIESYCPLAFRTFVVGFYEQQISFQKSDKGGLQSPQGLKVKKREHCVPGKITVAVRLTKVFRMIEIYLSFWV